jgi:hypothetical protein
VLSSSAAQTSAVAVVGGWSAAAVGGTSPSGRRGGGGESARAECATSGVDERREQASRAGASSASRSSEAEAEWGTWCLDGQTPASKHWRLNIYPTGPLLFLPYLIFGGYHLYNTQIRWQILLLY